MTTTNLDTLSSTLNIAWPISTDNGGREIRIIFAYTLTYTCKPCTYFVLRLINRLSCSILQQAYTHCISQCYIVNIYHNPYSRSIPINPVYLKYI